MKIATIKSDFHGTAVQLVVPDRIETTKDAMEWLATAAHWDRHPTAGGAARRKYNRIWRDLCPHHTKGTCKCSVTEETI